jgi:hypothetical protein
MTLPIRLVPYATGYDLRIDYLTDRVPPLLPPDAVWADDLLRRCALSAEAGVYVNWGMSVNKIFDPAHEELSGFDDYDNVIDGVVQEDVPVIKVLSHFYQADSGAGLHCYGLPSPTSSKSRANELVGGAVVSYRYALHTF